LPSRHVWIDDEEGQKDPRGQRVFEIEPEGQ
jgi:hypothetical protein